MGTTKNATRRSVSTIAFDDPRSVWQDKSAKTVAYFCRKPPIKIDGRLLDELKRLAARLGGQNVRLCLHESPEAVFHEMIILEHAGKYYRPHKHTAKGESYHIIEGSLGVIVFDEQGKVEDACVLNPHGPLVYRIGANMYHMILPLSEFVIYHESKPGPFVRERDSLNPSWAPDGGNTAIAADYVLKLQAALERERASNDDVV